MEDPRSDAPGNASGQSPAGEQGEAPAQPAQPSQPQQVNVDGLVAKNAELLSELKAAKEASRQRKAAADDAKVKAGEFEPLLREREAELETARAAHDADRADAAAYRAWRASEESAIEAQASVLDEGSQAALKAVPDLAARRVLLDKLTGSQPKQVPPEHPAGAASEPAVLDPSGITPGMSRDNPEAWARFKEGQGIGDSKRGKPFFS